MPQNKQACRNAQEKTIVEWLPDGSGKPGMKRSGMRTCNDQPELKLPSAQLPTAPNSPLPSSQFDCKIPLGKPFDNCTFANL